MPSLTDQAGQQKDHLCGPFHAARILRDCGIREIEGEPLDQDLVALHAGTTLPDAPGDGDVPPGAQSWAACRHKLPTVDPRSAGTSARGLASAIEQLSGGRLACVPVSGRWSASAVRRLVAAAPELGARLVANLRTGLLWGSRPPLDALLAVLAGDEVPDPPPAEWDVGHFVELSALMRGRGGALVLVCDSYPSLGLDGVHLQPPSALAAALARDDGRGGGVLAVVPHAGAGAAAQLTTALGLAPEIWDN